MRRYISALIFLSGLTFFFPTCRSKAKTMIVQEQTDFCAVIDTIFYNKEHHLSNEFLTNHLDQLVKQTGLTDHCNKGTAGCLYANDSIFHADMHMFRTALGCQHSNVNGVIMGGDSSLVQCGDLVFYFPISEYEARKLSCDILEFKSPTF